MSDVIIDMAMAAVLESEGQSKIKKDVLTNVRRFVESLMTTTYEGRPAELAVAVVTAKDKGQKKIDIQTLLALKKTSTLFGGHRHVLVCNQKGEVHGHSTLVPYPDVFPKRGNTPFYVAPYEYQPIMRFSDRRSALTFLLTRRREILVIVGPQILFIRTNRGWRVLALDRFLDLLGELLWKNAKGRLSKKDAGTFAMHLGLLCLTLRQRGKGGLFVVFRRGKQINDRHDRVDQAEDFLQSIIGKQSILTVPVSMMCNAAAVDGATLLRWDSRVERFGVIVNTAKRRSVSEGARTRAAEFLSAYGVAIKISEDGQITLFGAGKELTAID